MAQRPTLAITQKQRLAVTKSMQQSVEILAMPNSQLLEFLKREEAENPIIELIEPIPEAPVVARGVSPHDQILDSIPFQETLIAGLVRQLSSARISMDVYAAAEALIGNLNAKGHLEEPVEQISLESGISLADLEVALTLIQGFDPVGVGATSVFECIELQLKAIGLWSESYALLLKHLAGGTHEPSGLANQTGLEKDTILRMLDTIRRVPLDMSEVSGAKPTQYVQPDIHFSKNENGEVVASLNKAAFPRIHIRPDNLTETRQTTDGVKSYVAIHSRRVNWLSRALLKRAKTILNISKAIGVSQEPFFRLGPAALMPLTMKEIARNIGVHESTVSRAVSGKFFLCDYGTFSMRMFFSTGFECDGLGSISGKAIRTRISRILEAETAKNVLSDAKITELLALDGITVARRTVAKYRESMNVPASSIRRIQKRSKLRN